VSSSGMDSLTIVAGNVTGICMSTWQIWGADWNWVSVLGREIGHGQPDNPQW
jgi:hypothetical protein